LVSRERIAEGERRATTNLAFIEEFTIRIVIISIGIIKVIALLLKTVLALDKVDEDLWVCVAVCHKWVLMPNAIIVHCPSAEKVFFFFPESVTMNSKRKRKQKRREEKRREGKNHGPSRVRWLWDEALGSFQGTLSGNRGNPVTWIASSSVSMSFHFILRVDGIGQSDRRVRRAFKPFLRLLEDRRVAGGDLEEGSHGIDVGERRNGLSKLDASNSNRPDVDFFCVSTDAVLAVDDLGSHPAKEKADGEKTQQKRKKKERKRLKKEARTSMACPQRSLPWPCQERKRRNQLHEQQTTKRERRVTG